MSSHYESFDLAHQAHLNWQVDRPLIDKFNHSDLKVALKLLGDEIEELNGGDHTGIFSEENIKADHRLREDYRQQEIADIVVFAMTSFDELGLEIPTDRIYDQAEEVASHFNFKIVEAGLAMKNPAALTEAQNDAYLSLRALLNHEADFLLSYEESKRDLLPVVLENVLVYAVAMHSLIGVDTGKAVLEKVARNMLKYPAAMFALPEEELDVYELEKTYHEKRAEAATLFDGPKQEYELIDGEYQVLDRSRQVALNPDNVIEDRPKTGTTEFYAPQEHEQVVLGELRQIGIFYRAMAQVVASTYGFSVKVSSLLSRSRS